MKDTTRKAYTEVIEILKYFPLEYIKKIPSEKLKVFFKYRDENYEYKVDENKAFKSQNMMEETKAILYILFEDYLATEEQKEKLKQKENEALKQIEEEKRRIYNPDNLFKNKKETETEEYIKKANIILVPKDKWYNKIIKFLKKFIKIKE